MPYVLRKFHCCECGAYTERKLSSKQKRRCVECGLSAMIASALEMAAHKGAAFANWKASNGPNGRPRNPQKGD